MTDILTQGISAWADVGDTNFRLKNAEVTRATGRTIGTATVKGLVDETEELEIGDEVRVYVSAQNTSDPWEDRDLDTSGLLFVGDAHSAKQDEEGIVTIEAYDTRDRLHSKKVQLATQAPQYAVSVIANIIEEVYGSVTNDRNDAGPDTPYIAPREEFPVDDIARPWRFGNAERGIPLIDALEKLTTSIGAQIWVDREGVLNITPYPEHTEWKTPFVVDVESGEESKTANRIIFEGTGNASELGQGAAYVHSQTSYNSESEISGPGEGLIPAINKSLSDSNVSTQEEADRQAFGEAVNEQQRRDMGEVSLIGNAEIDLYDHIKIPELEYNIPAVEKIIFNDLQEGRYKIDQIRHVIGPDDGFQTKLKLTPAIDQTYNSIDDVAGLSVQYLERYSNSVTGENVSGVDDFTAILSGLLYDNSDEEN